MNVDVGHVRIEAKCLNSTDGWQAVTKHLLGDWGDANPNEKFNIDKNSWRRHDSVISRHTDRSGIKFVIVTDFSRRTTTVRLA